MPPLFTMKPESITYDKYREQRAPQLGDILGQRVEAGPKPSPAPVPTALVTLADRIETLEKAAIQLEARLSVVSAAPCPEAEGIGNAQITHGTSQCATQIIDSCVRVERCTNIVLRMINNLEI